MEAKTRAKETGVRGSPLCSMEKSSLRLSSSISKPHPVTDPARLEVGMRLVDTSVNCRLDAGVEHHDIVHGKPVK